jgi:hypothetical protein
MLWQMTGSSFSCCIMFHHTYVPHIHRLMDTQIFPILSIRSVLHHGNSDIFLNSDLISLGTNPKEDHTVILFSISSRNFMLFLLMAVATYICTNSVWGFLSSIPLKSFVLPNVFYNSYSKSCKVISSWFGSAFSWLFVVLTTSSYTCWPFLCLLWRKMGSFAHFYLDYMFSAIELQEILTNLDINSSDMWLTIVFPRPQGT